MQVQRYDASYFQSVNQVICWEAGGWLPALNIFCHSSCLQQLFFWVPNTFLLSGRWCIFFLSHL